MPATATGRGAQVILTTDAQAAARGAYAPTFVGNAAAMETMVQTGVVADGNTTQDGTTKTGGAAYDPVIAAQP